MSGFGFERRDEENLLSEVRSVGEVIVSGRECVDKVKDVGC